MPTSEQQQTTAYPNLDDDRPRGAGEKDWLGLESLATHLTTVLSQPALRTGFTIGIEGPWGAGKSTLIRTVTHKLGALTPVPGVIVFNPWLIGDRESLLTALFGDVADAIERMEDATEGLGEKSKEAIAETARKVRSYATHVGALSKALSLAGMFAPGGSLAGAGLDFLSKSLEKFAEAAESLPSNQPLTAQKEQLESALQELPVPLIVFVDDLERLEPAETLEMVRLIRAVGDLPNIIYVLCYDREVLVANLEHVLAIKNGNRFLEKIVQVTLPLPQPESFTLRNWFFEEALAMSSLREDSKEDAEALRRLRSVVYDEGGVALETPRDVVRALNSLKLYWPPIQPYVDFADLVWVQLVRLKSPPLYNWVVNYVTQFADVARVGAVVLGSGRSMRDLKRLLRKRAGGFKTEFFRLRTILPGLELKYDQQRKKTKAQGYSLDRNALAKLTREARLGSPHYFRYYFAFGPAAEDLHETEVSRIIRLSRTDGAAFQAQMLQLSATKTAFGVQISPMIDRLTAISGDFDHAQAQIILTALAECMDVANENDAESFGVTRSWEAGERLWRAALNALSKEGVASFLRGLAERGAALGWLARRFSLDLYSAQRESTHWTADDVKLAISGFTTRIALMGGAIKSSSNVAQILHLWCITDGADAVKEHVQPLLEDDEFFLKFLKSARGWVGADRVYRPLRTADLEELMDYADARTRVRSMIAKIDEYPSEISALVTIAQTAFEEADHLRR